MTKEFYKIIKKGIAEMSKVKFRPLFIWKVLGFGILLHRQVLHCQQLI